MRILICTQADPATKEILGHQHDSINSHHNFSNASTGNARGLYNINRKMTLLMDFQDEIDEHVNYGTCVLRPTSFHAVNGTS